MTVYTPGTFAVEHSTGWAAYGIRLGQRVLRRGLVKQLRDTYGPVVDARRVELDGEPLTDWMFRWNHAFGITDPGGGTIEMGPKGAAAGVVGSRDVAVFNATCVNPATLGKVVACDRGLLDARVGYNWLDYASEGLISAGIQWSWITSRVNSNTRMICSQAVDQTRRAAGWDLFPGKTNCGDVVPVDLGLLIGLQRLGLSPSLIPAQSTHSDTTRHAEA